jgi:DNA integrity scanning protein DisA with diadenylate cyclase activity
MFDFLDFNILDIIDIVLVAMLLYYAYRLVKGTAAINIFVGIVILYLIWKITDALNMELLSNILGGLYERWGICPYCCFSTRNSQNAIDVGVFKFGKPKDNQSLSQHF